MKTCSALTKKGKACKNGAMEGSPFCGPHTDQVTPTSVKVTYVEPVTELNPLQKFTVWVREQMPSHKFCCQYHKDVVDSMVSTMATRGLSAKQIDYARSIVMGKARHQDNTDTQDPEKIFTIKCYRFKCQNQITGTRYELAALENACPEHRK